MIVLPLNGFFSVINSEVCRPIHTIIEMFRLYDPKIIFSCYIWYYEITIDGLLVLASCGLNESISMKFGTQNTNTFEALDRKDIFTPK